MGKTLTSASKALIKAIYLFGIFGFIPNIVIYIHIKLGFGLVFTKVL